MIRFPQPLPIKLTQLLKSLPISKSNREGSHIPMEQILAKGFLIDAESVTHQSSLNSQLLEHTLHHLHLLLGVFALHVEEESIREGGGLDILDDRATEQPFAGFEQHGISVGRGQVLEVLREELQHFETHFADLVPLALETGHVQFEEVLAVEV